MSHTVDTQRSWKGPAAPGPDVQWVDLYFPRVEDLLHRLVETQTAKQHAVPTPRFGSWKMATVCAVYFICMPGYATPAGRDIVKSGNTAVPPIEVEPAPVKADRLPLIATATPANYFNDANYFDEAKIHDDVDVFEQPPLRGTVEDIALTAAPAEPQTVTKPKLRRSIRAAFARIPLEAFEPAPRAPSPLEKLFSVFVPQFSQPPSQRQM